MFVSHPLHAMRDGRHRYGQLALADSRHANTASPTRDPSI